jgi:hypothetical protein
MVRSLAVVLNLTWLLLLSPAWAAGPQPPCASQAVPGFGTVDGPPTIGLWDHRALQRDGWQPPACLGWQGDSRLVTALAARFRSPMSLDALTERLAAVSHHPSIRFWAVTLQEWRPLVTDAWALERPDAAVRWHDPTSAELVPGRELYYAQQPELGSRTIWRMRVLERSADRVVLTAENVSPIRLAVVTIFEPGALQIGSVLQRDGEGTWDLYEITRAGSNSSSFVAGYGSSYLNRLEAMRRYLAGLPTDRDPPVAPR